MLWNTKISDQWTSCIFVYNLTSSDTGDWTVLSRNPMSCETTNSDHFLTSDYPESHRKRPDPEIGSDQFRMYEFGRNSRNPISGYQRKTVDTVGIWRKVTDRIRLAVKQRIQNPSDRIRRTHFDLGIPAEQSLQTGHSMQSENRKKIDDVCLLIR